LQEGGGPNTPIHHPQLRMKPLRETEPSHGVMELHPRRIEGCESPPELWKCLGKPQDHLPETARGLQVLCQIRVYLLHIITYSHHHHLKRARRALALSSTTLSAGASRSTHSNHGCAFAGPAEATGCSSSSHQRARFLTGKTGPRPSCT